MRTGSIIALLLGLVAATALVAYEGFSAVGGEVAKAGWGVLAVAMWRFVPITADGLAWRTVLGPQRPRGLRWPILFRWIRDSVNTLLPVAQVGGDVLGVRLLTFRGIATGVSAASVLADKTLEVFALFVFVLAGTVFVIARGESSGLAAAIALGLVILLPFLVALLAGQWLGLGRLLEWLSVRLASVCGFAGMGLDQLHETLRSVYRSRLRCLGAFALHLAALLADVVEVWLLLWLMGSPVSLADAFAIETMGQAVRSAAFAVPASLGAQEAGYTLVAAMVGLPPEVGLALSLLRRVCFLVVGVPGLLLWQGFEGRRLIKARSPQRPADLTPDANASN